MLLYAQEAFTLERKYFAAHHSVCCLNAKCVHHKTFTYWAIKSVMCILFIFDLWCFWIGWWMVLGPLNFTNLWCLHFQLQLGSRGICLYFGIWLKRKREGSKMLLPIVFCCYTFTTSCFISMCVCQIIFNEIVHFYWW